MKVFLSVTNHIPTSNQENSLPEPDLAKRNSSESASGKKLAIQHSAVNPENRALLATKTILGRQKIETPAFGGFFKKKSSRHESHESGSSSSNVEYSNVSSTAPDCSAFHLGHVPFVSQGNERNGCWYACARMVGHSVESGPRLGLPELYDPRYGHNTIGDFDDMDRFIQNEGLNKVDLPANNSFSPEQLLALLYRHGPIIFGWQTPSNDWHMSVITGVAPDTSEVIFHDPRQGPNLAMPLSDFNERLAWQVPHAMLYR
ncbi:cysteine protease avirulence protein AvrRpt2 [Pseudomonas amygdali]|uniref:papain-like cysteine protease family protein n=1 Tax=Pseudomonas amygdali TaxID=47877 RepID=UPI000CD32AF2|nr:papain-like cysteine protease family protein [Pseudomonas amygdali]MBI6732029.1 cysteine protease avirulence protein AvrRpt2 [Pseudomonas amygdali]MBI6813571.1 cysteine protease avirulence protein AvrRpt2 [Pseudomonas amygdali]